MPFLQFGDFLDRHPIIVVFFLLAVIALIYISYRRAKENAKPKPTASKSSGETLPPAPPEQDNTKVIKLIPIEKKPKNTPPTPPKDYYSDTK